MWPWLEFLWHCLLAVWAGSFILLGLMIASSWFRDWIRARGWDPVFRAYAREWEETFGRPLTQRERMALVEQWIWKP